jgi:hypothetical protein
MRGMVEYWEMGNAITFLMALNFHTELPSWESRGQIRSLLLENPNYFKLAVIVAEEISGVDRLKKELLEFLFPEIVRDLGRSLTMRELERINYFVKRGDVDCMTKLLEALNPDQQQQVLRIYRAANQSPE